MLDMGLDVNDVITSSSNYKAALRDIYILNIS